MYVVWKNYELIMIHSHVRVVLKESWSPCWIIDLKWWMNVSPYCVCLCADEYVRKMKMRLLDKKEWCWINFQGNRLECEILSVVTRVYEAKVRIIHLDLGKKLWAWKGGVWICYWFLFISNCTHGRTRCISVSWDLNEIRRKV